MLFVLSGFGRVDGWIGWKWDCSELVEVMLGMIDGVRFERF